MPGVDVILNVSKNIKGKEYKPGEVLAGINCDRSVSAEDVVKAIMLGQVQLVIKTDQTKTDQKKEKISKATL